jgi:hypothetical protein
VLQSQFPVGRTPSFFALTNRRRHTQSDSSTVVSSRNKTYQNISWFTQLRSQYPDPDLIPHPNVTTGGGSRSIKA